MVTFSTFYFVVQPYNKETHVPSDRISDFWDEVSVWRTQVYGRDGEWSWNFLLYWRSILSKEVVVLPWLLLWTKYLNVTPKSFYSLYFINLVMILLYR